MCIYDYESESNVTCEHTPGAVGVWCRAKGHLSRDIEGVRVCWTFIYKPNIIKKYSHNQQQQQKS